MSSIRHRHLPCARACVGAPLALGLLALAAASAALAPAWADAQAPARPPHAAAADTLRPARRGAPGDTARARTEGEADAAQDAAYVREVEQGREPYKVLHAEPLYVDLIRDLGARRGEAEWNVGFGLTDRQAHDAYKVLVEYEWAPRDRRGVEIELPATVYSGARLRPRPGVPGDDLAPPPASRLDGLKTAVQWTAHVSERRQTSFALGYLNALQIADPRRGGGRALRGNVYNPFVVGAKRWTHNAHTLVYTGAQYEHAFGQRVAPPLVEVNASAHYMLSGTRNFVGVEVNAERERRALHTVVRPQMRLGITDRVLLGVAVGVPVGTDRERMGTFFRLIYEPSHRMGGSGHAPAPSALTPSALTPSAPPRAPSAAARGAEGA
jgi:hypothetical protein